MDRDRLSALADHLSNLPTERFSMAMWAGRRPQEDEAHREPTGAYLLDCGTAGCLAGWAVACWRPETSAINIPDTAADILDLDWDEARELFRARGRDRDLYPDLQSIPLWLAIQVLRRAAKTGVVSWQ